MSIVKHIVGALQGKHPLLARRSGSWPRVRAAHLAAHPACEVCGGVEKLEVHHRKPFHLDPALELDPANLITLCEANRGGVNCHLFVGHLGNFKAFNPTVVDDAATWQRKLKTRPLALPTPEGTTQ
jgi:hypothetical protein